MGGSVTAGRILRERRLELGLKIKDLADAIDVSSGTVSGYERGHKTPGPQTISRLSSILEMDGGDLRAAFGKPRGAAANLVLALAGIASTLRLRPPVFADRDVNLGGSQQANRFEDLVNADQAKHVVDQFCRSLRPGGDVKLRLVGSSLNHRFAPLFEHILSHWTPRLLADGVPVEYFAHLAEKDDDHVKDILFALEIKARYALLGWPFKMAAIDQLRPPFAFDVAVFGDAGAILSFGSAAPHVADTHMALHGNVSSLAQHTRLVRGRSSERVTVIPESRLLDFLEEYHDTEVANSKGPRLMVQRFFGDYSRSPTDFDRGSDWYQRQLQRGHNSTTIARISKLRQQILGRSRLIAETRELKQICSKQVIERWVASGERPGFRSSQEEPASERLRRLGQLHSMLKNDKFSIAFVDRLIAARIGWQEQERSNEFAFVVQGDSAAIIEMTVADQVAHEPSYTDIYAVVKDDAIVSRARKEFESLWADIPDEQKSAAKNIQYLEKLMAQVAAQVASR